jgi:hypothetical protein
MESGNVIYIGKKPVMAYCLAVMTAMKGDATEVTLMARGRAISTAVDVAEVVWGSDFFYAFHDAPDFLKRFLDLITETYAAFMRAWFGLVGRPGTYATHWGMMFKGVLMIRNDSLMNLSPEAYAEFARPMDQRLFDEFGRAGGMHFCGRGDHYIAAMSRMEGLTAVAMSQPHLNDMETIYRNTVDKGIKLIGLRHDAARSAGRPLRGQVQCYPAAERVVFAHKGEVP